ncbi:unnamed protein product [Moneuplotes crassus]|uniref:PPM-type phosphatase domain-containing protein n=1 Tax=Euplotes crassus TaxID=5936 RepID=A0AAD2DAI4_EUPCR|nr:unnamed protein product [Moneuplotes crassus]
MEIERGYKKRLKSTGFIFTAKNCQLSQLHFQKASQENYITSEVLRNKTKKNFSISGSLFTGNSQQLLHSQDLSKTSLRKQSYQFLNPTFSKNSMKPYRSRKINYAHSYGLKDYQDGKPLHSSKNMRIHNLKYRMDSRKIRGSKENYIKSLKQQMPDFSTQPPSKIRISKKDCRNLRNSVKRNASIRSEKSRRLLRNRQMYSQNKEKPKIILLPTSSRMFKTEYKRENGEVFGISQKGFIAIRPNKPNQDRYFTHKFEETGSVLMGVFDGHGKYGHEVSQFANDFFQEFLKKEKGINKSVLRDAFQQCETALESNICKNCSCQNTTTSDGEESLERPAQGCKLARSGTTALVLYITKDRVLSANVGDSQGAIFTDMHSQRFQKIIPCNGVHNLKSFTEKDRIIESGGRIDRFRNLDRQIGPERVFLPEKNFPGLNMTRSLGDKIAKTIGVSPNPEIREILCEASAVVIGSDGLWEHLHPSYAQKILQSKEGNLEECCKSLVKCATNCWKIKDKMIDDITIAAYKKS